MASPSPQSSPTAADVDLNAAVPFMWRLANRMVIWVMAMVLMTLAFTGWRAYELQLGLARTSLREASEALIPFMLPAIKPAIDLAEDALTGKLDESLVQPYLVKNTFEVAKKNRDLVYAEFFLATGKRVALYAAQEDVEASVGAMFKGRAANEDIAVEQGDLIARQHPMFGVDGRAHQGTLRLAFSLGRVKAQANSALGSLAVAGLVLLLVAAIVVVLVSRSLLYQPLAELLRTADSISHGTIVTGGQVDAPGELGVLARAFHGMARALASMVRQIQHTAGTLATGVGAILARSEATVANAREQASATREITNFITDVDQASQSIDRSLASLIDAANHAADETTALSRSLKAIEPQAQEFGGYIQRTDASMRRMVGTATSIATNVAGMADATEGVATTVIQFETTVKMIGDNAAKAVALSQEVQERAEAGQGSVTQTVHGMQEIAQSFRGIDAAVGRLGLSADAIGRALEVITEVTQRTQLLSLNASILAAQAGEQGKAFSVVASEIKALSDRTNRSTAEISDILATLSKDRAETASAMAAGMRTVKTGEERAAQAGQSIAQILELSGKNNSQMTEIAKATREQVQGSQLITGTITDIAQMVREIGTASQEQKQLAEAITALTSRTVASVDMVVTSIRKQAADSVVTASRIHEVLEQGGAIRDESASQRKASGEVVRLVSSVHDVANQVLGSATQVMTEAKELASQADLLNESVAQFRVEA